MKQLLAVLTLLIWWASAGAAEESDIHTVIPDRLNVRATPDINGKVLGQLNAGNTIGVMERNGAWARISIGSQSGWVYAKFLRAGTIENRRKSSDLPPNVLADKYLQQAAKYRDEKDFENARIQFDKILELDVSVPPEFYYHFAKILMETRDFVQADENIRRYIKLAGRSGRFYRESLNLHGSIEQQIASQKEKDKKEEKARQLVKSHSKDIEEAENLQRKLVSRLNAGTYTIRYQGGSVGLRSKTSASSSSLCEINTSSEVSDEVEDSYLGNGNYKATHGKRKIIIRKKRTIDLGLKSTYVSNWHEHTGYFYDDQAFWIYSNISKKSYFGQIANSYDAQEMLEIGAKLVKLCQYLDEQDVLDEVR